MKDQQANGGCCGVIVLGILIMLLFAFCAGLGSVATKGPLL